MRFAFASYRSQNVVPLGVLSLASALRESGHQVVWLEAASSGELIVALRRSRAEAVGFSATTGAHALYLEWAGEVKRALELPVIFGGPHPTFVPEFAERWQVDAIVRGEAEETLPELLDQLEGGLGDEPIAGVWHRPRGRQGAEAILRGPLRPPPLDLDALAEPAYDLVYDSFPRRGRYPVKSFLASRGCAYRCAYCANTSVLALQGRSVPKVRLRTPRLVIEEIQRVRRRWPMRLVWLADACLLTRRRWATELLERLHDEVGLPYFCKVRPDHITEAAADLLARTGCHAVGLGIESGDDRIRRLVLGRSIPREVIVTACQRLKARGVRVLAFNMVGIPTEGLTEALETVDLNRECAVDFAEAMLLQPYPGTPLAAWAEAEGAWDGDPDQLDYSYLSTTPFRLDSEATRDQLERLQRLFGLAVEFPEVRRALPWLVRRSMPRLYDALFRVWYEVGFNGRIHQSR